MDFTQHHREEPETHQKAQLFLLKKYQKEMFSLCIYMENESKLIDKEGLLFDIMKNSKKKIEYFLIIIEKCINFYHFGCEVFLYYVKKIMENEVKSVKDYSDEYTVSLSDLRGRELFTNLHYVLMSFPFTL
jgi:membrane-anchored glycerophosphoryl diester phosphodiesterase (GDPDase)